MMGGRPPASVSLNFMPAFYRKHLGLRYGEAYYFDPRYRAEIELAEGRLLYEILGRFGVGSPRPEASPSLFIQPIDLFKLTQDAELYCPPDASLETRGHPWAGLTPGQVGLIDAASAARHPIIDAVLRQYRELEGLYGERADLFGIKSGLMTIHAPFTTAHQLCGESIFFLLVDDPGAVELIFAKVWEIYGAIFERLARELGVPVPRRIQLGDCSASMLSPELYRASVLPANRALAGGFEACGYHSCGPSTHLLRDFAAIPGMTGIELGPGTDMAAASRILPGMELRPLIDPLRMLNDGPAEIEGMVRGLLEATVPAPSTTLCAWSFDAETPIRNVEALYRTVFKFAGN
jgi:hypothetical protein